MTKVQCLEERVRLDDEMCERINRIIDSRGEDIPALYAGNKHAFILGQIQACLELAGWRKGSGAAGAGGG
jgi:hypothetical protein